MSQNITIKTTPEGLTEKLKNARAVVNKALARELTRQLLYTTGRIQENRMTGKGPFPASEHRLGLVSGRLRRSVRSTAATVVDGVVTGAIGSNVKYMGVHEFGGSTAPHIIEPKRLGKSLRFMIGGRVVFAKMVKHPGSRFPARAPIFTGIQERESQIGNALTRAVSEALEEKS